MAQTKKDVNILLLGESGSGKSTFINSLANYLKYETLQEAMNSKPECLISTSFTMADENYEDQMVSINHHSSSLCSPGDIFGDICEYKFHMENATIRVIDTPAVGDARGVDQDKENVKRIVSALSNYSYLNAIVFLLKSNVTIVSEYFKFSIQYLLSLVDRTAFGNIIFVLTHSRSTFYKPGETMTHLKTLIKSMDVDIPCDKSNIFCVDNETFRYLVASYRGMNFTSNEMTTFSKSWERSRENCLNFLEYVASMKEQTIGKRQTDKYTPQMLAEMGPLLLNMSMALGLNSKILEEYRKSKNLKKIELFTIVKATADNEEAMICKGLRCNTIQVKNSSYVIDKKICHKPCSCVNKVEGKNILECKVYRRNGCTICNCPPSQHKRVKNLRVLEEIISSSSNLNWEETLVEEISAVDYEYDLVTDALALLHLHAGMSKNYIFEALEVERNRDYNSNKPIYSRLREMFKQKVLHLQETNANKVQSVIDDLYNSKLTGKVLIQIFGEIEETKNPIKEEKSAPVREVVSNEEFTFDKYTSSVEKLLSSIEAKAQSHKQLEKWHGDLAKNIEKFKSRLVGTQAYMNRNQGDTPDFSNPENVKSTGSQYEGAGRPASPKKPKDFPYESKKPTNLCKQSDLTYTPSKQKETPCWSNKQKDMPYKSNWHKDYKS